MFTHFHNRHIPVLPLLNWTHQSSLLSTRRNWKSHAADGKLCYQMGTIPTHHHTAKNFKLQKLFKQLFLYRGQHCFDWRFVPMKCHLQRLCNSISIVPVIQTFQRINEILYWKGTYLISNHKKEFSILNWTTHIYILLA